MRAHERVAAYRRALQRGDGRKRDDARDRGARVAHRGDRAPAVYEYRAQGDVDENAGHAADRDPPGASLAGEESGKNAAQDREESAGDVDRDIRFLPRGDFRRMRRDVDKRERGKREEHEERNREDRKPHSLRERPDRIASASGSVELRDVDGGVADRRRKEADEHDGDH